MRLRTRRPATSPMTDLDKLLRQYIERFESGGDVDPSDLIAQAETGEQAELRELIAGYLEHAAPGREWDAAAFEGSVAERAVARTAEEWSAAAGELPVELVRLRNEREITRADLVTRLADSLGVSGAREKVASYYHRLERGLLPAEGVSSRVWEALAQLLDTSAEALRRAGGGGETAADRGGRVRLRADRAPTAARIRDHRIIGGGIESYGQGALRGTRRGGPPVHRRLVSARRGRDRAAGGVRARRRAGMDLERRRAAGPGRRHRGQLLRPADPRGRGHDLGARRSPARARPVDLGAAPRRSR